MQRCLSCMQEITEKREKAVCPHCGQATKPEYDASRFLKPGTMLGGKFLVGKVLGAGGFGITYIGWNQLLQCKVAIKEYYPRHLSSRAQGGTVMTSDAVKQQKFRAGLHRFLEEARSIASLQDVKGVVQVYTFFEENGTGYIIMEFLEGMDVKHILKQRGNRMDYPWSRRVILTVLYTLREIHKRGVLHRDIAPDNVFVTNEGVIKLIDFGAAKQTAELVDAGGEIVLKEGYAPPEQYTRTVKQGTYTDLYAVAAMFYRILTGKKPPSANERKIRDTLKPLSELGVQIPEQAEMGIMVCLNLAPQYRLQSAENFMEALEGLRFVPVYEPEWILPEVKEVSPSMASRVGRMPAWQRGLLVFGMLVLVAGTAGGVVFAVNHAKEQAKEVAQVSDVTLPQFANNGTTKDHAVEQLKEWEITPEIVYSYDAGAQEEEVISMEPSAGEQVSPDLQVKLVVKSREFVTLPDYSGKKVDEVKASLKECLRERYRETNLFSYNYNDSRQKDLCYDQTQKGTVEMEETDNLKIFISWGKQSDYEVAMPDLRGMTKKQANKLLESKKLPIRVDAKNKTYSEDTPKKHITSQGIKPNTVFNGNKADKVNYNMPDTVIVTISEGPKPTPKPTLKPTQRPKSTPAPSRKVPNGTLDGFTF